MPLKKFVFSVRTPESKSYEEVVEVHIPVINDPELEEEHINNAMDKWLYNTIMMGYREAEQEDIKKADRIEKY